METKETVHTYTPEYWNETNKQVENAAEMWMDTMLRYRTQTMLTK